VLSISSVADLTDAPNPDVVPFEQSYSTFTVYSRHSGGEDKVVHLLDSEPIRCPLSRRGSFLGDGRDMHIGLSFGARIFLGKARSRIRSRALNDEMTV
jgi:hypothetical protein